MIRGHRVSIVAVLSLGAAVAAMTATPDALAATAPGWRLVSAIHKGPAADINSLSSVVAVNKSDAWAFGGSDVAIQQGGTPTAEHWNGHWRAAALPAGLAGSLGAASAPGRSDIWAVSQLNGYVLHYNGTKWSVAKKFPETGGSVPEQLTGVAAGSTPPAPCRRATSGRSGRTTSARRTSLCTTTGAPGSRLGA
jgi:hypothetical protein